MNKTIELKTLTNEYEALKSALDDIKNLYGYSAIKWDSITDAIESEIDNIDLNVNILKINMNTGTVWTKSFYTIGTIYDDLMDIIDSYATQDDCILTFYEAGDVLSYEYDYIDESFLPINGGEKYTDTISSVEELLFYDFYNEYVKSRETL